MGVSVHSANRLWKDRDPTAVELHSDCRKTTPSVQKSVALSTVAGVRRLTRTQARRGGSRHCPPSAIATTTAIE
jgi:hypothetical protein